MSYSNVWAETLPNVFDTNSEFSTKALSFPTNYLLVLKVGSYWTNFLRSAIFPSFHNYQNIGCLYNITFIFGRCRRTWVVETPGKYEHDL